MTDAALDPCKHCGSKAWLRDDRPSDTWIECDNCGMSTAHGTFEVARAVWNRRAVAQAETVEVGTIAHIDSGKLALAGTVAAIAAKYPEAFAAPITPSPSPPDEVRELCERAKAVAADLSRDKIRPHQAETVLVVALRLAAISARVEIAERELGICQNNAVNLGLKNGIAEARAKAAEASAATLREALVQVDRTLFTYPQFKDTWLHTTVTAALAPLPEKDKG